MKGTGRLFRGGVPNSKGALSSDLFCDVRNTSKFDIEGCAARRAVNPSLAGFSLHSQLTLTPRAGNFDFGDVRC